MARIPGGAIFIGQSVLYKRRLLQRRKSLSASERSPANGGSRPDKQEEEGTEPVHRISLMRPAPGRDVPAYATPGFVCELKLALRVDIVRAGPKGESEKEPNHGFG